MSAAFCGYWARATGSNARTAYFRPPVVVHEKSPISNPPHLRLKIRTASLNPPRVKMYTVFFLGFYTNFLLGIYAGGSLKETPQPHLNSEKKSLSPVGRRHSKVKNGRLQIRPAAQMSKLPQGDGTQSCSEEWFKYRDAIRLHR